MWALKSSSKLHVYKHCPARACSRRLSGRQTLLPMGVSENRLGSERRYMAKCQMSKIFIDGSVCREFAAAEEMLDRVVCSREQFSFQMCLESGDGSGTFCN